MIVIKNYEGHQWVRYTTQDPRAAMRMLTDRPDAHLLDYDTDHEQFWIEHHFDFVKYLKPIH